MNDKATILLLNLPRSALQMILQGNFLKNRDGMVNQSALTVELW